ncbi:MAG: cupredoxin domain-containing protein [Actinomycetota bacterium]
MRRTWITLGTAFALVSTACAGEGAGEGAGGGGDGAAEAGGSIMIGGKAANDHGEADVSGMTSAQFEVDDFYFEPTVLEGEAGQSVTLEVFNEGQAQHTFTVDALEIDETLAPDARMSIEVTMPASGALLVYCRFHETRGMLGALSVGGDLTIQGGAGVGESEDQGNDMVGGGGYG